MARTVAATVILAVAGLFIALGCFYLYDALFDGAAAKEALGPAALAQLAATLIATVALRVAPEGSWMRPARAPEPPGVVFLGDATQIWLIALGLVLLGPAAIVDISYLSRDDISFRDGAIAFVMVFAAIGFGIAADAFAKWRGRSVFGPPKRKAVGPGASPGGGGRVD